MDINTKRGQISRQDECRAIEIFQKHFVDYKYIETPKNQPAIVDGVILKNNQIHSLVETKCRYNLTIDEFMKKFKGQWLVTFEKIEKSRKIACNLGVGLSGFLYLKEDDALLVSSISDSNGLFKQKVFIEATETQKTINGGLIVRNNAYIDMTSATILRMQ